MIPAYDKQTGDGNWLRQSLQIFQEAIDDVQRTKSKVAEGNKRTDAGSDFTATTEKDLQGGVAG